MRLLKTCMLLLFFILASCSSLKITTDYDTEVDFTNYKTYAFSKKRIDKADISDLDKKRILKALEMQLEAKGFTKSKNPDLLIGIFTKSRERINIQDNNWNFGWGWGWGWNPWMWGGANRMNVTQYTEGTLFIDFVDKKKNQLIWQGVGSGALRMKNVQKRKERINQFVKEIIDKYPPSKE